MSLQVPHCPEMQRAFVYLWCTPTSTRYQVFRTEQSCTHEQDVSTTLCDAVSVGLHMRSSRQGDNAFVRGVAMLWKLHAVNINIHTSILSSPRYERFIICSLPPYWWWCPGTVLVLRKMHKCYVYRDYLLVEAVLRPGTWLCCTEYTILGTGIIQGWMPICAGLAKPRTLCVCIRLHLLSKVSFFRWRPRPDPMYRYVEPGTAVWHTHCFCLFYDHLHPRRTALTRTLVRIRCESFSRSRNKIGVARHAGVLARLAHVPPSFKKQPLTLSYLYACRLHRVLLGCFFVVFWFVGGLGWLCLGLSRS